MRFVKAMASFGLFLFREQEERLTKINATFFLEKIGCGLFMDDVFTGERESLAYYFRTRQLFLGKLLCEV